MALYKVNYCALEIPSEGKIIQQTYSKIDGNKVGEGKKSKKKKVGRNVSGLWVGKMPEKILVSLNKIKVIIYNNVANAHWYRCKRDPRLCVDMSVNTR